MIATTQATIRRPRTLRNTLPPSDRPDTFDNGARQGGIPSKSAVPAGVRSPKRPGDARCSRHERGEELFDRFVPPILRQIFLKPPACWRLARLAVPRLRFRLSWARWENFIVLPVPTTTSRTPFQSARGQWFFAFSLPTLLDIFRRDCWSSENSSGPRRAFQVGWSVSLRAVEITQWA